MQGCGWLGVALNTVVTRNTIFVISARIKVSGLGLALISSKNNLLCSFLF